MIHEEDRERVKNILERNGYSLFAESLEFIQMSGPCPIDLQIARRPMSKRMLSEAVVLPGLAVKCLRAEDIIALKIQAYSTNSKREFKGKVPRLDQRELESLSPRTTRTRND